MDKRRLYRQEKFWLGIGGLALLCYALYLLVFVHNGWVEGNVNATVHFADGTPAGCVAVEFTPIEIIGPYSSQVRRPMLQTQTNSDGSWMGWPYGEYRFTVFADNTRGEVVAQHQFMIWPTQTTRLNIVLDDIYAAAQPAPPSCGSGTTQIIAR